MGKLGFARIHRFSGIFRLCICLVMVGIIILGATERTAAAPVTGNLPVIKVFTGDPLTVPDGGHVVYMFEVYDGTKIQVIEDGVVIDEFNGPPSTTSKGKSTGMTTNQIRTGNMDSYDTILRVSNPGGQREQKLKISFATKSKPKPTALISPVSDNGTGKKNKWGPQSSAPVSLTSSTALPPRTGSPFVPTYAACPSGCNCLTPDQAAEYGFKQKCFEQRCFSTDKQVNSYCYSKSAGWCCKDGKVTPAAEAECKEAEGIWYDKQQDAIKACQPEVGWFCSGNKVYQGTSAQATQAGVKWYTNQQDAINACQQVGWFCSGSKVYQGTLSQAAQAGVTLYATQAEAIKACEQCWCCTKGTTDNAVLYAGQVTQMNPADCAKAGGNCYATQASAQQACEQTGYCCSNGNLTPANPTQCAAVKGVYYTDPAKAKELCQQPLGYGCINSKVAGPMTQAQATQQGATYWSTNQAQVLERCQVTGYGCINNNVTGPMTEAQAKLAGATYWSTSQAQVLERCKQITYYCCNRGQLTMSTVPGTGCYTDRALAEQACQQTYWCCINGQLTQSKTFGAGCYKTQAEAIQACQRTYWCCSNGQVYQSKTPGAGCYATQAQAVANCPKPRTDTPYSPPSLK